MKKIIALFILFLGFFGNKLMAQYNLPMISQYYTNPYLLNPAQAGGYDYPVAYLIYKGQWNGVSGNPVTTSFTANKPFMNASGIGINIYQDQSGFLSKTKLAFSFSQTVFIDLERQYISFGLSAGLINQHLNLGMVVGETGKPIDPIAVAYNNSHPIYPDFDFGIAYRWRYLEANLVLPNLGKFINTSPSLSSSYADLPLYFASLSYEIPIGADFRLEPMIASHQIQDIAMAWDFSALLTYKNAISIGAFYHNNQSYSISLGYLINKTLDVNYAYTQSNASIQQYFGGTNEISLGIHFSKNSESKSSKNHLVRCPKFIF